jgi:membrane fusion protein (multidrug efflux system)
MKHRRLIFVVGGLVALLIVAAVLRIVTRHSAATRRRVNVAAVRVDTLQRDTVINALQTTGDVVSIHQADIVAEVGGSLEQVLVNIGDNVRQGQLLALIDTTELVQTARQTAATFFTAKADFERKKQLRDSNLVSPQDYEDAEAAMKVAEANDQTAQTRLGYARITAPFAGTITKRDFDPGALVNADGSTVFTLMDLDSVKVVINVMEKYVPQIAIGIPAVVTADALPGDTFAGYVGRTSQAVDPASRTMPVEIFVKNREYRLKPGMYATVSLILGEHPNAITVPADAVLTDANGTLVYTVVNDTARRVAVQPGLSYGARTEIVSGLTGSERIITTGQQLVRNGGPVQIQQ